MKDRWILLPLPQEAVDSFGLPRLDQKAVDAIANLFRDASYRGGYDWNAASVSLHDDRGSTVETGRNDQNVQLMQRVLRW